MKNRFLFIIILLFVSTSCNEQDEWKPSEKEQKDLEIKLERIQKKSLGPDLEFYLLKLYWYHPEVAVLHYYIEGIHINTLMPDKIDSISYSGTSIFLLTDQGWQIRGNYMQ